MVKHNVIHYNNDVTDNIYVFLKKIVVMLWKMMGLHEEDKSTKRNILIDEAVNHTTEIFQVRFTEMISYNGPTHNFIGEGSNQLIALFRLKTSIRIECRQPNILQR